MADEPKASNKGSTHKPTGLGSIRITGFRRAWFLGRCRILKPGLPEDLEEVAVVVGPKARERVWRIGGAEIAFRLPECVRFCSALFPGAVLQYTSPMRHWLIAAALGLPLLVCGACSGTKTAKFVKPRLAVEFPLSADRTDREPRRLTIPVNGGVGTEMAGDDLRRLPGTGPGLGSGPPITLSLSFEDRGDKVAATVYAVPPESDPNPVWPVRQK